MFPMLKHGVLFPEKRIQIQVPRNGNGELEIKGQDGDNESDD